MYEYSAYLQVNFRITVDMRKHKMRLIDGDGPSASH